ncbi:hypothetical protein MAPG_03086 [Magnaporthiopsis poae ATCC 64411]|uniref:Uncharacterized protein n=1 Tax=Magnaporthiopsis poae (strain ATCC 64411 / 73-15) TaxID=644358 RepID=A0A0C4DT33_MAGP6|nr:hypothetical protein MAPG_03086 [Magnaporthiopsis poae ATCC 64411]
MSAVPSLLFTRAPALTLTRSLAARSDMHRDACPLFVRPSQSLLEGQHANASSQTWSSPPTMWPGCQFCRLGETCPRALLPHQGIPRQFYLLNEPHPTVLSWWRASGSGWGRDGLRIFGGGN